MSKGVAVCVGVCLSALLSAVGIACLVIAANDGNNPCQGHDATNLNLKDWLIGYGVSDLIFVGILWICAGMVFGCDMEQFGAGLGTAAVVLWGLFKFCWTIVGIVVLARSNGKCVADGTDIGVMVVVALAMQVLSGCTVGGGTKSSG